MNGALGVLIFSGSLPATRLAVRDFEPLFLTAARACIAAAVALALLLLLRQPRPTLTQLRALAGVALGVVLGFPLLTALALRQVDAAHSIVFLGLLPLVTAACGVWRGGERPRPAFWAFSALGSALLLAFALSRGAGGLLAGDGLMLLAILVCGYGYAEGAQLTRQLGGWQVISWALVLALPAMAGLAFWQWPASVAGVHLSAWLSLGYVSLFSMLIGFVFWYRGLQQGGVAAVSQLQLLQPLLGLALAALLLNETVSAGLLALALALLACVLGARRFA
ncbi:DMT family transporter [Paucibacter sp. APW11]|uniref:DMT family transporter n=1 Tax=Roseateles aquae TaxID=3077235 RepID=A0ABU3PI85_9BURK|nr:DMT family transporter [Paucibacter sp. APW11]MDT9002291.1 DMT family transporter [Paucibacter sp. APW11]